MRRAGAVTMVVFAWLLVKWTPGGPTSISEFGDFIGGPKPDVFTGWGTEEEKPPAQGGHYVRVYVPGLSMEEAQEYTGFIYDDGSDYPRSRRGNLSVTSLPSGTAEQAETYGVIEVPATLFRSAATKKN